MNSLKIMTPVFLFAIGGWALTQSESVAANVFGYIFIFSIFVVGILALLFLKTPPVNEIDRKTWINFSILEKVKWKLRLR